MLVFQTYLIFWWSIGGYILLSYLLFPVLLMFYCVLDTLTAVPFHLENILYNVTEMYYIQWNMVSTWFPSAWLPKISNRAPHHNRAFCSKNLWSSYGKNWIKHILHLKLMISQCAKYFLAEICLHEWNVWISFFFVCF